MKVKELRRVLERQPDDAEIHVIGGGILNEWVYDSECVRPQDVFIEVDVNGAPLRAFDGETQLNMIEEAT